MQNRNLLLVLSLILSVEYSLSSQSELQPDRIWKLGVKSDLNGIPYGTEFIKFNDSGSERFFIQKYHASTWSYSCISDEHGLFLLSDGINVFNKELVVMENGFGLNPGEVNKMSQGDSYPIVNGMFSVFRPGKEESEIDIIHMGLENPQGIYKNCPGAYVYHTRIDKSANDGLGRVLFKNRIIENEPFKDGGLAACRHANGRDWWFAINPCDNSLKVFLLGPDGPKLRHKDSILIPFGYPGCQSVFSPDGKFFALHTFSKEKSEVHLLDFDRCTGHFSNHRVWYYLDPTGGDPSQGVTVGVAISQNSRFMYIISRDKIHQYDLWSNNIPASDQVVAVYDGYIDKYGPTLFSFAQLAPDGKIYIVGRGTMFKIHVIDEPDKLGLACNVKQHSVDLTFPNSYNIPYFPYFRLGAEKGTVCDSLITSNTEIDSDSEIFIHPNPSKDKFTIAQKGSRKITRLQILDIGGELIRDVESTDSKEIDVSMFTPGVYILRLFVDKDLIVTKKFFVQ